MELLTGIIREDGTVLAEDGTIHPLPIRGINDEGYKEIFIDAKEVGGDGWMCRQSIKPFIGMTVEFVRNGPRYQGYNFTILKTKN